MTRLKIVNGYVGGILPTSKPPDWKTIFPDNDPVIQSIDHENLRDEYGNLRYRVEQVKDKVSVRDYPEAPSHEQIEKKSFKDKVKETRQQYTMEEEIAKIRNIVLGLQEGEYLNKVGNIWRNEHR